MADVSDGVPTQLDGPVAAASEAERIVSSPDLFPTHTGGALPHALGHRHGRQSAQCRQLHHMRLQSRRLRQLCRTMSPPRPPPTRQGGSWMLVLCVDGFDVGQVACPVCGTAKSVRELDAHLDLCLVAQERRDALRKPLLSAAMIIRMKSNS